MALEPEHAGFILYRSDTQEFLHSYEAREDFALVSWVDLASSAKAFDSQFDVMPIGVRIADAINVKVEMYELLLVDDGCKTEYIAEYDPNLIAVRKIDSLL